MYNAQTLLDIHVRAHESLRRLIGFCGMRVVTHIFNHQGQVLAMCRTLGKPNDRHDLDYPVDCWTRDGC